MSPAEPYYRPDLALVHHLGYWQHATACAPGILQLLEPVLASDGLVVELGCGSGLLTKYLVDAGHRVIATDASPAMLDLAARHAVGAEEVRLLRLPDDPIPQCDAIVSTGHVLSYLDSATDIERSLAAAAAALRTGGILAVDIADLEWGRVRGDAPPHARLGPDWAIITAFELPSDDEFVRNITTFVRHEGDTWRRDDERHHNVLIDTSMLPELLASHGVSAEIRESFGDEQLPVGLKVVVGTRLG